MNLAQAAEFRIKGSVRFLPAVPVIEEPYHLSYPFLFEFEGELYMIPEKARATRVDLYRCVAFPYQWELVKTLIEGFALADSTLVVVDLGIVLAELGLQRLRALPVHSL